MRSSGLIPEPLNWNRGSRAENLLFDAGGCGHNLGSGTVLDMVGHFHACILSSSFISFHALWAPS